jgi:hypothetical protein
MAFPHPGVPIQGHESIPWIAHESETEHLVVAAAQQGPVVPTRPVDAFAPSQRRGDRRSRRLRNVNEDECPIPVDVLKQNASGAVALPAATDGLPCGDRRPHCFRRQSCHVRYLRRTAGSYSPPSRQPVVGARPMGLHLDEAAMQRHIEWAGGDLPLSDGCHLSTIGRPPALRQAATGRNATVEATAGSWRAGGGPCM